MQINNIRENLQKLLENKIDISNRDVLVFGAGNTSDLCKFCFESENIDIKAFIDNNPKKQGKKFFEKKVIPLDKVSEFYDSPIILISSTDGNTRLEIKNILEKNNFDYYILDEFVFSENIDNVLKVFDLFEDDKSKEIYADVILSRIDKKSLNLDLVSWDKNYAVKDFRKNRYDEVFVDCGAYVGDTIEEYIKEKEGVFYKIYAFEPDFRNFNALKCRMDRIKKEWALSNGKIICVNAGVGEYTSKLAIHNQNKDAASLSAIFSNEFSDNGIDVYALDDYFADQKISFIKADIESFEEKMIRGAKNVIKRDKPLMAICVYHSPSDMYRIPLLLKDINPEYRFSLRQHSCELCETVLYAY